MNYSEGREGQEGKAVRITFSSQIVAGMSEVLPGVFISQDNDGRPVSIEIPQSIAAHEQRSEEEWRTLAAGLLLIERREPTEQEKRWAQELDMSDVEAMFA